MKRERSIVSITAGYLRCTDIFDMVNNKKSGAGYDRIRHRFFAITEFILLLQ